MEDIHVKLIFILVFISSSAQIEVKYNDREDTKEPIVKIPKLGRLRGSVGFTKWTSRSFYQFLGVPYAEAPSGARRFKPPVAVKPWSGVRNVIQMGQSCAQLKHLLNKPVHPSKDPEDCLNMNIFTPSIRIDGHRPVIVYVHGGSFNSGSNADYPPNYLLERDIVLVVPNYRVDALGFLSTKTAEIPGNAGMLDVVFALKWVKKNIKYFGGNPNKITVMGQSAGAAMVSSLLLSPLVPVNLFQQMIIHSGSAFASWTYALDPVSYAKDIAYRANVPKGASLREINDAFMKMDAYELLNATNEHYNAGRIRGTNRVGGRSLTVGGPSNYLPYSPMELSRRGSFKQNINLIIGVVKNEGSFITAALYDKLKSDNLLNNSYFMKNMFLVTVVTALGVQDRWTETFNLAKSIFSYQISTGDTNFRDYATGFSELAGMVSMKEPVLQLALTNDIFNPRRTFLYTFDYRGANSRFGYEEDTSHYPFDGGISHSDDLIYLFPHPPNVADLNEVDTKMAMNMVELWTSFAEYGTPQIKSNPKFQWPPKTNFWGPYLHINQPFEIGSDFTDEFLAGLKEESYDSTTEPK